MQYPVDVHKMNGHSGTAIAGAFKFGLIFYKIETACP